MQQLKAQKIYWFLNTAIETTEIYIKALTRQVGVKFVESTSS